MRLSDVGGLKVQAFSAWICWLLSLLNCYVRRPALKIQIIRLDSGHGAEAP